MSHDYTLYEKPNLPQQEFPIRITLTDSNSPGTVFKSHWHEEIEFLFFTKGMGLVSCNSKQLEVKEGDFVIFNSNELHMCRNMGTELSYFCIIVDPMMLHSNLADICDVKYISPIRQNLISFTTLISGDEMIAECIRKLVSENEVRNTGYELAIKSLIYNLFVVLIRKYVDTIFGPREYLQREKRLQQINMILKYIEDNYMEQISTLQIAKYANISEFYLCHLFKKVTGMPLNQYINQIRISKAEFLLKTTDLPVTEIAFRSGYTDSNYFSRIYKKFKKVSPSQMRKKEGE